MNCEAKSSLLAYAGEATIRLKNGDKVYKTITSHNSGQDGMFKFLLNCLRGGYSNFSNDYACYIGLYKNESEQAIKYNIPYESVSEPSLEDGVYSSTFHFLIPDIVAQGIKFKCLKLISAISKEAYAVINLTQEVVITSKTNIEIDQTVTLGNKGEV